MSYTVTKSTAELYKLRHPSGMYWADITIDCNDKGGRIQIASDYGSWQNYWAGFCGTFKEFLIQLNLEYAADKFNADRWFDHEGTMNKWKRDVLDHRRRERMSGDKARAILDELKQLDDEIHEHGFIAVAYGCKNLMRFYLDCPEIERTITPGFKQFWKKVWPVFIEQLRSELKEAESTTI